MLQVVNPRGLLALPVPRPEQDLPAAEQQLRMIWWTSEEVYRHVAGVTWESYDSMHKPTVEQLLQVSLALSRLPCLQSSRVTFWSLVVLDSECPTGSRSGVKGLAGVALEACMCSVEARKSCSILPRCCHFSFQDFVTCESVLGSLSWPKQATRHSHFIASFKVLRFVRS